MERRRSADGIQYVEHAAAMVASCTTLKLGLEGIVSKRLTAPYKSGPCKSWIKVRNPQSPADLRIIDEMF
jgi:bifunctional non-homologous end joining protein LigD